MNLPQMKDFDMGRVKDEYVGRVKEAAGVLVDNDDLRQAGRRDQQAARVKHASTEVKRKVDDVTDKVVKKSKQTTDKVRGEK